MPSSSAFRFAYGRVGKSHSARFMPATVGSVDCFPQRGDILLVLGRGDRADLHRLPFVVRTVQPALEDLDPQVEEAAAQPGRRRLQTFVRVICPQSFRPS